jgi:hypothetical protein
MSVNHTDKSTWVWQKRRQGQKWPCPFAALYIVPPAKISSVSLSAIVVANLKLQILLKLFYVYILWCNHVDKMIDFCYFTLKIRDLKSVDNIFIYAIMAEISQVAMLARSPLCFFVV